MIAQPSRAPGHRRHHALRHADRTIGRSFQWLAFEQMVDEFARERAERGSSAGAARDTDGLAEFLTFLGER